jgi:hypothetical protein
VSRPLSDYVALALIGDLDGTGATNFAGEIGELASEAVQRCGFPLREDVFRGALETLSECGLARISNDQYAGEFLTISPMEFQAFVRNAKSENAQAFDNELILGAIDNPSRYPNGAALAKHPVFEDYSAHGDEWLRRAFATIRQKIERDGGIVDEGQEALASLSEIPASDRVVALDHNQQIEIQEPLDQIIDEISSENAIDGDSRLLQIIKGQLKAGRELIKEGPFKLYTLQVTLIAALGTLVEKYKDHAIGAAAGQLLDLLLIHVGLK